jgi:cytochrome c556
MCGEFARTAPRAAWLLRQAQPFRSGGRQMRAPIIVIALILGCLSGSCATKNDEVAETTGKTEPQTRMSPQDLEQLMQKIGPTYQSLRKTLEGTNIADAAKPAQQLGDLFGGVEKFWTQHNRADAVKWAGEARTYASEAAGTAAAGNTAKATAAVDNLGGVCKQCHGTYRESDGQGGYRIKAGVVPQDGPT